MRVCPSDSEAAIGAIARKGDEARAAPDVGFKVVDARVVRCDFVEGGPKCEGEARGFAEGEAKSGGIPRKVGAGVLNPRGQRTGGPFVREGDAQALARWAPRGASGIAREMCGKSRSEAVRDVEAQANAAGGQWPFLRDETPVAVEGDIQPSAF